MIVGNPNIQPEDTGTHVNSYEDFILFCDSLVPSNFKHNEKIIFNQRYLCAVQLRKNKNVPWKIKKDIIEQVMSEIYVTGLPTNMIGADYLLQFITEKRRNGYDDAIKTYKR